MKARERTTFYAIFSSDLSFSPLTSKFGWNWGFLGKETERRNRPAPLGRQSVPPAVIMCLLQGKTRTLRLVFPAGRAAAHGNHAGHTLVILLMDAVSGAAPNLKRSIRRRAGTTV